MERNLLIPTYPKTKLRMTESVGVSVLTNIQLLDYCLMGKGLCKSIT